MTRVNVRHINKYDYLSLKFYNLKFRNTVSKKNLDFVLCLVLCYNIIKHGKNALSVAV
jgi:hypothetical protein